MSQDNIDSTLKLVGLVLGAVAAGGGVKTAALIHGNIALPGWLHFTPAVFVSAVGEAITLAAGYGLHLTQENINSIQTLVGLIAAGLVVGGAITSNAAIRAGVHPALPPGMRKAAGKPS